MTNYTFIKQFLIKENEERKKLCVIKNQNSILSQILRFRVGTEIYKKVQSIQINAKLYIHYQF